MNKERLIKILESLVGKKNLSSSITKGFISLENLVFKLDGISIDTGSSNNRMAYLPFTKTLKELDEDIFSNGLVDESFYRANGNERFFAEFCSCIEEDDNGASVGKFDCKFCNAVGFSLSPRPSTITDLLAFYSQDPREILGKEQREKEMDKTDKVVWIPATPKMFETTPVFYNPSLYGTQATGLVFPVPFLIRSSALTAGSNSWFQRKIQQKSNWPFVEVKSSKPTRPTEPLGSMVVMYGCPTPLDSLWKK